jgi:hypothetical protein
LLAERFWAMRKESPEPDHEPDGRLNAAGPLTGGRDTVLSSALLDGSIRTGEAA